MIIKKEGWEAFDEHTSSAQFCDDPHRGTYDDPDYQVDSAFLFLCEFNPVVWRPLCAHEGWWPIMRFSVVGTDVLIFSLFWLQPGDGDGDDTGFTPRPKRSLKLKPSRGRMKRANQSKNQQPLSCKYYRETFTYSSKPIRLSSEKQIQRSQRSFYSREALLLHPGLTIPFFFIFLINT